jgi:hypothetical protein
MARVVNILPLFYLLENYNSLNLFELLIKQVLASELLFLSLEWFGRQKGCGVALPR